MTDTLGNGVASRGNEAQGKIRVWDPLVRVFHWSLVSAFAIAWLTADELQPVHEIAGYVVAALVAFRLVWGVVGSRYARFSQFLRGPGATVGYLGDMARGRERRYVGHNPAGAAMIVALLVTLSGTALTGWLMEEPSRQAVLPVIAGPAYGDDEGDEVRSREITRDDTLKDVHGALANSMLLLAALHVGGVVLASFRHRENLAHSMMTGDKRAAGPGDVA